MDDTITPLRKARIDWDKTLTEVATAVGTDEGNLSRIERGEQQASPDMAEKLAKYYGGKVTELQIIYPRRFSQTGKKARA